MILPKKLGEGTIHVLRKRSNHQRFRLLALLSVPLLVTGVQQQVGYKSLQTTQIYTRLTDEDVRKSYERVRSE